MALETGKIRNVAVVGHGGVGKTSLVEAMLFAAGAVTRLGRGRRRQHHHRLRSRRDQAQDIDQHLDRLLRLEGPPHQPGRHPRLRRLHRGRAGRAARGRGGRGGRRRRGRRAGADREGLEVRRRVRPAPRHRRQPARPRALGLLPHAGVAGAPPQGPHRPRAHPGRRGGRVPRLRRPGDPARHALRRRQGDRGRHPGRGGRPREGVAREAGGGGGRDRRRPAGQVPRGGLAGRAGDAQGAAGRHQRRARSCRSCARPPPRASAATPCSTSSCTSSRRRPTAARSAAPTSRPSRRALAAPTPRRRSPRWCSRRCPIRTSASSRSSACTPAPCGPTPPCSTSAAAPGSAWATSPGCRARPRRPSRRWGRARSAWPRS